tara:strand:+ start:339 stop:692 length:354 start_codon:yes stop_codon:yes gene_type:complete
MLEQKNLNTPNIFEMKKLFLILLIILCSCTQTINKNKISLKEQQRNEDIKTCEYYGFSKETKEFSNCLMKLEISRNEILTTKKMLECESVRKDNLNSKVTGFWGGVLLGMRENLACG